MSMDIINSEVKPMNEKVSNRDILEKFAREIMKMETKEQIDSFIKLFVYGILYMA